MRRIGTLCSLVFLLTLTFAAPRTAARAEGDPTQYRQLVTAGMKAFNTGHILESLARLNEAVAEAEKVYGPDTVEAVTPLTFAAFACFRIGDIEKAKSLANRAKTRRDKNRKEVSADVSKLLDSLSKRLDEPLSYSSSVKPGAPPMDFKGKGLDGKPVALKDYAGKVVLIDFWATWCPPCREEIPLLVQLHKKYAGKGFEILGVSLDGPEQKKVVGFTQQNGMTWRHVYDGGGWEAAVSRKYAVSSIPFTVLVGKDGKIIAVGADAELLDGLLEEMLGGE